MNTTFLGQSEFIKHGGFLFLLSDESCLAVNNIEWAEKSCPVIMLNFKMAGCLMKLPMKLWKNPRISY